jgi:hypothetical protein
VSVDAHIVDFCVRTAITQDFVNTESFPIEAVYVFPLDERAAVCGFEAEIDGVVTKGVVQEKQQARDTYEQAIAHGDGAQLLEQKRTDVFELKVGNLLPGQRASITIVTVADLKIEGDDVRFFLPTFVAPRYHPHTETDPVPSGKAGRVRDGLQLSVSCTMSRAITAVQSPTHPVVFVAFCGLLVVVTLVAGWRCRRARARPRPRWRPAPCSWTRTLCCWCARSSRTSRACASSWRRTGRRQP